MCAYVATVTDVQHDKVGDCRPFAKVSIDTKSTVTTKTREQSSINGFAVEILLEIFSHYVQVPLPESSQPTCRGSPVTLSRVCSLWRAIAHSCPTLWATITLSDSLPGYAQRLKHYVSLSGAVPISLTMKVCRPPSLADNRGTAHLWDACALAISLFPRCRHIYLDINWALEHTLVAQLPAPSSPPSHLESIVGRLPGWSSRNALRFSAYLHLSPKLRTVKWKGMYTHSNGRVTRSLLANLPMDNIRNITLGDFHSFEDLAPALRACERLEELSTYVCKPSHAWMPTSPTNLGDSTDDPRRMTLSKLHTLSLHTFSPLTHVFATLTLPSLTSISIEHFWDMNSVAHGLAGNLTTSHHHHTNAGWNDLRLMLERSGSKLRSLVYTRYGEGHHSDYATPPVNEAAVIRLLESPTMKELCRLHFTGRVGNVLLKSLTLPTASGGGCSAGLQEETVKEYRCILPRLEDLTINECWSSDGVWSEMVLSRSVPRTHPTDGCVKSLKTAKVLLRGSSLSGFGRDLMLTLPGMDVGAQWDR